MDSKVLGENIIMGCSANKDAETLLEEQDVMRARQLELTRKIVELEKALLSRHEPSIDFTDLQTSGVLTQQLNDLQGEISSLHRNHKTGSAKILFKHLVKGSSAKLRLGFNLWADLIDDQWAISTRIQSGFYIDEAFSYLKQEKENMFYGNPLIKIIDECSEEELMDSESALQIFEDFMDYKHQSDSDAISQKTILLPIDKILLEFLDKQFGADASKTLKQLVFTLKRNKDNQYLTLFSKIICLHPQPVPPQCSFFMVKMRMLFEELRKERSLENDLSLVDVLDLVSSLVTNRDIRTIVIHNLKPHSCEHPQFFNMLICYRIHALGYTPDTLFEYLGIPDLIPINQFISHVENALEIKFPKELKNYYHSNCDPENTGNISKASFLSLINFDENINNIRSAFVSKIQFLNALLDVQLRTRTIFLAKAFYKYSLYAKEPLDLSQMLSLIRTIDPSISPSSLKKIEDASARERINKDYFCKTVLLLNQIFNVEGIEDVYWLYY